MLGVVGLERGVVWREVVVGRRASGLASIRRSRALLAGVAAGKVAGEEAEAADHQALL